MLCGRALKLQSARARGKGTARLWHFPTHIPHFGIAVTHTDFLIIIAGIQGAFLVALVVMIVLTRLFWMHRRLVLAGPQAGLRQAMRAWTHGAAGVGPVLKQLRRLPRAVALNMLVHYGGRTPAGRWQELVEAVGRERWVGRVRSGARSRFWWRRLEAGQLLTVAARPQDLPTLLRLLADPHPAVLLAAIGALERVRSAALDAAVLKRLARLPRAVQAYAMATLQQAHAGVVPVLARILVQRDTLHLEAYVDLAGRLGDPVLRAPITDLADHASLEVRTAVARALAVYPHEETVEALRRLAKDKEWQARAQAIHALGKLQAPVAALLREALRDPAWWVRLRAALALARAGPEGRNALLAAEIGADVFARDMARMVLGLSPEALAEYVR